MHVIFSKDLVEGGGASNFYRPFHNCEVKDLMFETLD